jgi:hypothetical protein
MKEPHHLKNEAEAEAYEYFDRNIRALPKDGKGKIDPSQIGFHDNDVDAFRHAYVSGIFAQEYGEAAADIFGRMNEWSPLDAYSNSTNPGSKNMDLWNNSIGRKYGARTKDRRNLLKKIQKALANGELIVDPKDKRHYEGVTHSPASKVKPLIVLQEDKRGRNEFFYDTIKKQILSVGDVVALIEEGKYPGYAVKLIRGIPTPVSNPDGRGTNNLG